MSTESQNNRSTYEIPSIEQGWRQSSEVGAKKSPPPSPTSYGSVPFHERSNDGNEAPMNELDIEDAMERLGMGAFQIQILFAAVRNQA